jgi:predicted ArsR family transcriptional regulator
MAKNTRAEIMVHVARNGASGCSPQWLADRIGVSVQYIKVSAGRLMAEGLLHATTLSSMRQGRGRGLTMYRLGPDPFPEDKQEDAA